MKPTDRLDQARGPFFSSVCLIEKHSTTWLGLHKSREFNFSYKMKQDSTQSWQLDNWYTGNQKRPHWIQFWHTNKKQSTFCLTLEWALEMCVQRIFWLEKISKLEQNCSHFQWESGNIVSWVDADNPCNNGSRCCCLQHCQHSTLFNADMHQHFLVTNKHTLHKVVEFGLPFQFIRSCVLIAKVNSDAAGQNESLCLNVTCSLLQSQQRNRIGCDSLSHWMVCSLMNCWSVVMEWRRITYNTISPCQQLINLNGSSQQIVG